MKLLIILLIIVGTTGGLFRALYTRNLSNEAAEISEGFNFSAQIKLRVADYYVRYGIMPADNDDIDLPPPTELFGSSVRQVAVHSGGVLQVDFDERVGERAIIFTPFVSDVSGLLNWACSSDSIDRAILERLKQTCAYLPATEAGKLMHAIANNDRNDVDALLATDVRPDTIINGNTPLMLAANIGNVDIVNSLLDAGAKVDNSALSSERRSPLMVAISSNNSEVVELLLSRGASVTRKDYRGLTALDHAISADQRWGGDRYRLMVSARSNPETDGIIEPIASKVLAKEAEQEHLQQLYIEYLGAAKSCHVKRLKSLLLDEGELNTPELIAGRPLASHIRQPDCAGVLHAHLLTKPGFLRSAYANLSDRVQQCDLKGVTRALQEVPKLDVKRKVWGESTIDVAVNEGCHSVVGFLVREHNLAEHLDNDVIVKAIANAPQDTLLKTIGILIASGADVDGSMEVHSTPLITAIEYDQPVVAKYLVDAGADVNQQSSTGSFPVIEAAKKGYQHLVLQMVARGADINARDRSGRTALFAAVSRGQQRLVQALLQAGANANITDGQGIDPVRLAENYNLTSIRSVLLASSE